MLGSYILQALCKNLVLPITINLKPAGKWPLHPFGLGCSWFPSWTPTRWMNWRRSWTTNPFVHPWYQPWHLDDNQCALLGVDPWGAMGLEARVPQKKIRSRKRTENRSCRSARSSDRRRKPALLREVMTQNPHQYEGNK